MIRFVVDIWTVAFHKVPGGSVSSVCGLLDRQESRTFLFSFPKVFEVRLGAHEFVHIHRKTCCSLSVPL